MVARSKMKKAIDRALGIRPYAFFALEFLVNFSYHTSEANAVSPYFQKTNGEKTLIVEIAANKGLCGGYNGNMFREVRKFVLQENILSSTDFIAVGKYAVQHAKIIRGKILHSYTSFSEDISFAEIETLSSTIKKEWETGSYSKVYIAFTNFKSTLSQKPIIRQLLPLSTKVVENQIAEGGGDENWIDIPSLHLERNWSSFVIEPSEEAILNVVIPQLVTVQIYHAVLDALAAGAEAVSG